MVRFDMTATSASTLGLPLREPRRPVEPGAPALSGRGEHGREGAGIEVPVSGVSPSTQPPWPRARRRAVGRAARIAV